MSRWWYALGLASALSGCASGGQADTAGGPVDADRDGFTQDRDCDDGRDTVFPGATDRVGDGVDQDCDGVDGVDQDGDGFASEASGGTDCDDTNAAVGEGTVRYPDLDGDGFGRTSGGVISCASTGLDSEVGGDCDDEAAGVHPGAIEDCDGVDTDCDGITPADETADGDLDGFALCEDCDDADPDVYPGAPELCDGIANDCYLPGWPALPLDERDVDADGVRACDGDCDDGDAAIGALRTRYPDLDGDGYGVTSGGVYSCVSTGSDSEVGGDCDDQDAGVHPGAPEGCDGVDTDCDGQIPADETTDDDLDGFARCADCADADPDTYPGAPERCDGFANDCDAIGWPALPADESDADADGVSVCEGDCADGDPAVYPGAPEYHDGNDADCDGYDWVCGSAALRVGPGEAFTTVQSAVDAFDQVTWCDGDVIEIQPATYVESVSVVGVSPVLRGVAGPAQTILQGPGAGRVLWLSGSSGRIEGLTITGGDATGTDGGGVLVQGGVGVVLDDLVVEGNTSFNGAGVYLQTADPVVTRSTFRDNGASFGGGLVLQTTGAARLTDLVFERNTANQGGALYVVAGSNPTVERSVFVDNTSAFDGGVALVGGSAVFRDVALTGNSWAFAYNGSAADSFTLEDATVLGGVRTHVLGNFFSSGAVTLRNVTVVDELGLSSDSMLNVLCNTAPCVLDRVTLLRPQGPAPVSGAQGALVVMGRVEGSNLWVSNASGPGLDVRPEGSGVVTNASLVGNGLEGAILDATLGGGFELVNAIVAQNGSYGVDLVGPAATVSYSDLWDNVGGAWAGASQTGIGGNIEADPLFVDSNPAILPSLWNLNLRSGSPAIDAGDPGLLDPDGSRSDMGYYGGPGAP